jgi:ATP dependent DNA ligase-like protein
VFASSASCFSPCRHLVAVQPISVEGGRSHFHKLLFRREWPYYYCFDALSINGEDLRALPLLERKRRLVRVLPTIESRILYLGHLAERDRDLFHVAQGRDLEGIVAKWTWGTYQTGRGTSWLKLKNPEYPQMAGRRELFEARHNYERPKVGKWRLHSRWYEDARTIALTIDESQRRMAREFRLASRSEPSYWPSTPQGSAHCDSRLCQGALTDAFEESLIVLGQPTIAKLSRPSLHSRVN